MIKYYQCTLLFVVLLVNSLLLSASPYALDGKSSKYAYRFEVSADEMRSLLLDKVDTISYSVLLAKPVDSCLVSKIDSTECGIGRWVWAWREGAKLHFSLKNVPPYKVVSVGMTNGLSQIKLIDSLGFALSDADVRMDGHRMTFNSLNYMYECRTLKKPTNKRVVIQYKDWVSVLICDGVSSPISYYYDYTNQKHYPIPLLERDIRKKDIYRFSYLITDKPKYRPHDTIHWKAVIINDKGRWSDDEYKLFIENSHLSYRKEITSVLPVSKGVYYGSICLDDSLQLRASESYRLILSNKKGRVVGAFTSDDYELKGLKVKATSPEVVVIGDTCAISVSVKDEKGDNVSDGQLSITLRLANVNKFSFPSLFIPDTMYHSVSPLSLTGTTVIKIPTSLFPTVDDINISYQIEVCSAIYDRVSDYGNFRMCTQDLLNANNESKGFQPLEIQTYETPDSVGFSVVNKHSKPYYYAIYEGNKIIVSDYLDCQDSTYHYVDNTLDVTNKQMTWRIPSHKSQIYTLRIANNEYIDSREIVHHNTDLRIDVEQTNALLPGAESTIRLRVTDNYGRPVPNADVTAFSHTSKFGNVVPLPSHWAYTGKKIESLNWLYFSNYKLQLKSHLIKEEALKSLYKTNMSAYYALLMLPNTNSPYVYYQKLEKNMPSQIAPFVVKDGELIPIEVLYIDSKPVYIGWSTNLLSYSFEVEKGKHNITIRTADAQYTMNNVSVPANSKFWISVAAIDSDSKGISYTNKSGFSYQVSPMPPFLTPSETRYFAQWVEMAYSVDSRRGIPYITTDNGIVCLENRVFNYATMRNSSGVALMPALYGHYSETTLDTSDTIMKWSFIPQSTEHIFPNSQLIVAERHSTVNKKKNDKKGRTLSSTYVPSTDDCPMTYDWLSTQWLERIDKSRANFSFYTYRRNRQIETNCFIMPRLDDCRPINFIIEDDSVRLFYGGNVSGFFDLEPKDYKLMFLYSDSSMVVTKFHPYPNGINYITLPKIRGEITPLSIELTDSIRRFVERKMTRTRDDDFNKFFDFPDEANAIHYGAAAGTRSMKRSFAVATSAQDAVLYENAIVEDLKSTSMFEEEATLEMFADEGAIIVNNIRADFSDAAYWRPDLRTDEQGQVTFTVRYPDDLTQWNEYFIAMKGRSRGSCQTQVVTRMDVVATLTAPRFAIEGDTMGVIGQCVNYTDSVLSLSRDGFVDGEHVVHFDKQDIRYSATDVFQFPISTTADSVSVVYQLRGESLADGEQRAIPIYHRGLNMVGGQFHLLTSPDTSIVVTTDTVHGSTQICLMGDMMSVLIDEIEEMKTTKYSTNDMLASQLIALLVRQEIANSRGERFKESSSINKLIEQLERSYDKSTYQWSWCGHSSYPSSWITNHVYTALRRAKTNGYKVKVLDDERMIVMNFIQQTQRYVHNHQFSAALSTLETIGLLGNDADIRNVIYGLPIDSLYYNERITHHILSVMAGGKRPLSLVDSIRHTDMLGGEYYGFPNVAVPLYAKIAIPYDYRCIETTLLVYRLMQLQPETDEINARMRSVEQWLLRQRCGGYWPNPYVSTRIIDAILPYVLTTITEGDLSAIVTTSSGATTYTAFPCVIDNLREEVNIEKHGGGPLYVASAQRWIVTEPEKYAAEFVVDTYLDSMLIAGVETDLVVTVTASADAEYSVIEVPIPAGCSYAEYQPYIYGETHREQLRHCVNIYCQNITAGTHTFRVRLIPRFSGYYTLNPAQVYMMYVPAFHANNKVKNISITRETK